MSSDMEKISQPSVASPETAAEDKKESLEILDVDVDAFLAQYHEHKKIVSSISGDIKEGLMQEKYNTATEKIMEEHTDTLNALGIKLTTASPSKEAIKEGNEQQLHYPELRIDIQDRNKFLNYLETLRPDLLTTTQNDFLIAAIQSLHKQVSEEYDTKNPDDSFFEFFRSLGDIIKLYKHFYLPRDPNTGLDPQIDSKIIPDLSEYLHAYKNGYLRELFFAQRNGLPVSPFSVKEEEAIPIPFEGNSLINQFLVNIYNRGAQQFNYDFLSKGFGLLREMQENQNAYALYYDLFYNVLDLLDYIRDNPKAVNATEEVLEQAVNYRKALKQIARSARFDNDEKYYALMKYKFL